NSGFGWINPPEFLYAGTEIHRRVLTMKVGVHGYNFFVGEIGCAAYRSDPSFKSHLLSGFGGSQGPDTAEGPNFRPDTRNRSIAATGNPSVWIAACHTPMLTDDPDSPRNFRSHFGSRQPIQGDFRFNVLHLDGHVDASVWKDLSPVRGQNAIAWAVAWWTAYHDNDFHPYGWLANEANPNLGLSETPMFEGAFDQNAGENRKVRR
ncbi:hypothetical protein ACFL01_01340, partial [Planctomycetota bacterium]